MDELYEQIFLTGVLLFGRRRVKREKVDNDKIQQSFRQPSYKPHTFLPQDGCFWKDNLSSCNYNIHLY